MPGVLRSIFRFEERKIEAAISVSAREPSGIGRRASNKKPKQAAKSTDCQRRRRRQGAIRQVPEMNRTNEDEARVSVARSAPSNQG
jgi:hypothetical protein